MSKSSPMVWTNLLNDSRAGNSAAAETLFAQLSDAVYRWLDHYTVPSNGVWGKSDVTQKVIMDVWRKVKILRFDNDLRFRNWLQDLLERRFYNQLREMYAARRDARRQRSLSAEYLLGRGSTAEDDLITEEDLQAIDLCVHMLPNDSQRVIELRLDGFSFEEIGSRMSRSADAARKLWRRAVREVRLTLRRNLIARARLILSHRRALPHDPVLIHA